jgi:hypothetical protein
MGSVRIIHDEQLQYGHILDDGKRASEEFAERGLTWPLPHADYGFTQGAHLTFASSDTSAGIQAADVIAGFVMRYVQDVNANGLQLHRLDQRPHAIPSTPASLRC